jgi:hypothetical protein
MSGVGSEKDGWQAKEESSLRKVGLENSLKIWRTITIRQALKAWMSLHLFTGIFLRGELIIFP